MGLFKKKSKSKSSSTTTHTPYAPWQTKWEDLVGKAWNMPALEGYKGQTVADFTLPQTQGQQMTLGAADNYMNMLQPAVNQANYNLTTGTNPFSNPMLQQLLWYSNRATLDDLQQRVLPGIRSNAIASNPYGSHSSEQTLALSALQQYLPRLQENYANQLIGLYETGQNRALQTMQFMPQLAQQSFVPGQAYQNVGGIQQALEQQRLSEAERLFQQNQMMPWQQMQMQGQLLGNPQGYTDTSKSKTTNRSSGGLGPALGGLAMGAASPFIGGAALPFMGGMGLGTMGSALGGLGSGGFGFASPNTGTGLFGSSFGGGYSPMYGGGGLSYWG